MSDECKLQKVKGIRKVDLQVANNTERQITDITDGFDPSNETLVMQLTAFKSSYQEEFNKIKELDNEIIHLLKPKESEKELEEIISSGDSFLLIFPKIFIFYIKFTYILRYELQKVPMKLEILQNLSQKNLISLKNLMEIF